MYRGAGRGWVLWNLPIPSSRTKYVTTVSEAMFLDDFFPEAVIKSVDMYLEKLRSYRSRIGSPSYERLRGSLASAFLSPAMRGTLGDLNKDFVAKRWPTRTARKHYFPEEFPRVLKWPWSGSHYPPAGPSAMPGWHMETMFLFYIFLMMLNGDSL